MMREGIERRLGRRDHFDVKALEQRPRAKLGPGETAVDEIEHTVRRLGSEPFADAEHFVERVIEPEARRRSPEKRIAVGENVPDLARVLLDRSTVAPRNAEVLEADALAIEHPEHIMIRRNEQGGRIGERCVVGEPLRIGMPMRAHDRQVLHRRVQCAGERALARLRGEQTVGIELERNHCRDAPC